MPNQVQWESSQQNQMVVGDYYAEPKAVDFDNYDAAVEEGWLFSDFQPVGTSDLTRIVLEGLGQMRMFGGAA